MSEKSRRRVLAVASGGGHWVQLLRLRGALDGHDVTFVTVRPEYRADLHPDDHLIVVEDATRWNRHQLVKLGVQMLWIILRHRPAVIISTGAAPGVIALQLGRLVRARGIWVDSIANCEEISMSGRRAGTVAGLWLTQWEHLATPDGPTFEGSVA